MDNDNYLSSLPVALMERLQQRAAAAGVPPDLLLARLLDTVPAGSPAPVPFQKMFDHAGDSVVLLDLDLRHLYVNPATLRQLGMTAADMYGKTAAEVVAPSPQATLWEAGWRAARDNKSEQVVTFDYVVNGAPRTFESRLTPIMDGTGAVQYLMGITRDITLHKRVETALRQSEERYAAFVAHSFEGITRTEFDAPIDTRLPVETQIDLIYAHVYLAECNDAMARMYGFPSANAMIGIRLIDAHAGADNPVNRAAFRHLIENGYRSMNNETQEIREDGAPVWFLNNTIGIVENGYLVRLWGTAVDITERKSAEAALRESEALFRATFEQAAVGMALVGLDGQIMRVNRRLCEMIGYSAEALVQMRVATISHPDDLAREQPLIDQLRAGDIDTYTLRKRYFGNAQALIWTNLTRSIRRDANGTPLHFISIVQDISALVEAEQAAFYSEEKYRTLIESSDAAISMVDAEGDYLFLNAVAADPFGVPPAALVGKRVADLFTPEETHSILTDVRQVMREETGMVKETVVTLENQERWFRTSIQPVRDSAGVPFAAMIFATDITERKLAEVALRQSEARQRALLQGVPDLIFRLRRDGLYLDFHAGDPALLVVPPPAFIGKHISEGLPATLAGELLKALEHAFAGRRPYRHEYRLDVPAGPRIFEARIVPIDDYEALAIVRDITAQHEAETARLEQERLHASLKKEQEFNALIHRAVSAMSHDVRSPLTAIAASKDILERYYDRLDESKRQARLDAIDRQLKYLAELIDEMVLAVKGSLSHTEFKPAPVDLEALCQISLNHIKETSGARHHLRFIGDGRVKTVAVDETLVSRIVINLLSNAVKFSPEGSEVRLELQPERGGVLLRVSDQGRGIKSEDMPHIFDAFFRAGEVRDIAGTGLGLSIVKDCVERHQGEITVNSAVGTGTTVAVWLPVPPPTA